MRRYFLTMWLAACSGAPFEVGQGDAGDAGDQRADKATGGVRALSTGGSAGADAGSATGGARSSGAGGNSAGGSASGGSAGLATGGSVTGGAAGAGGAEAAGSGGQAVGGTGGSAGSAMGGAPAGGAAGEGGSASGGMGGSPSCRTTECPDVCDPTNEFYGQRCCTPLGECGCGSGLTCVPNRGECIAYQCSDTSTDSRGDCVPPPLGDGPGGVPCCTYDGQCGCGLDVHNGCSAWP